MSATARIRELEILIERHSDLYYNHQPEISDLEFDALRDELASLDPANPVLNRIGADSADGFPKTRHLMPMGSQDKAAGPAEFLKWAAKVGHPEYVVQYKLDGASLELQYLEGRLSKAVTRGDGVTGDEITPNARRMAGVPSSLPQAFTGAVRGEVVMTRETHARKYADKANCRNTANGLMKRKDGAGSEDLKVVCYDAAALDDDGYFQDEEAKLAWLWRMGFETVPFRVLSTAAEVVEYRDRVMDRRAELPYDIDGLVIKGLAIVPEDMARVRPERQIAFKFSPERAVSTVRDVEWSETGSSFTPIGILDPVRLAGTMVQRANLCNTDMIRALSLRIGSRVIITKRGEIIPKIEALVENPPDSREIPVPTVCPSCRADLADEGTRLYCPNPECPKKSLHRLEKWLSVLDVRDFGSVILGKLHAAGRVRSIADLYTLRPEELARYDRMGDVLARKILRNLAARNEVDLAEFVAGLDIEGIGKLVAEKAAAAGFDDLAKLRAAEPEDLASVDGFGDILARTLVEGLKTLAAEIDAILAVGAVRIRSAGAKGPFSGMSFCFTGELSSMKRTEAVALVSALGGMTRSTVVRDLTFLVTNDPGSGSGKNRKAQALGVKIIGEAEFLALTGGNR
ncbi:MAG TPA: NAD-dependent DNA ligase LigA [Magnetospirillaceae bacterium]|nr:NAD-dependent DNA ligase LigA [Magnetospirillaceae bacterium]